MPEALFWTLFLIACMALGLAFMAFLADYALPAVARWLNKRYSA